MTSQYFLYSCLKDSFEHCSSAEWGSDGEVTVWVGGKKSSSTGWPGSPPPRTESPARASPPPMRHPVNPEIEDLAKGRKASSQALPPETHASNAGRAENPTTPSISICVSSHQKAVRINRLCGRHRNRCK
jgi:hypothetical protein